ncbi:MAG TPA: hypothetical protein VGT44_19440 [Ktedonobacteraceae bacterium]|nr:hypothetical protein [Ktedonobacteraceae bacterium]
MMQVGQTEIMRHASRAINQRTIVWGVLRYEFLMQIRRRVLWLAYGGFSLLLFNTALGVLHNPEQPVLSLPLMQMVASVTVQLNWLPVIGIGIFLADRLPRDRANKVDELFEAMPGTLRSRLAGKYFGCVLASLIPAFLTYIIFIGVLAVYKHTLLVFPVALLTYSVIVLPGILFVAAFTLACTAVLWVPLYQFLFVGYWFWGNMLSPHIGLPTLSGTILTPIGSVICAGIFGVVPYKYMQNATPLEGATSLFVLLAIPLLVMLLFYYLLKWEQARK